MYDHIKDTYFPQITQIHKEFENELPYLLGETPQCAITAATFATFSHQWRTTTIVNTTHIYAYLFSILYFNYLYFNNTVYI